MNSSEKLAMAANDQLLPVHNSNHVPQQQNNQQNDPFQQQQTMPPNANLNSIRALTNLEKFTFGYFVPHANMTTEAITFKAVLNVFTTLSYAPSPFVPSVLLPTQ